MVRFSILVFFAAFLVGAPPALSAPAFPTLIIPGQAIGPISLGLPRANLIAGWGHPDKVDTGIDTIYIYERFNTSIALGFGDVVVRIRTWHPSMKTKEGIGVGSARSGMMRVFGKPQASKFDGFLWEWMKEHQYRATTLPAGTVYHDSYFDDYPTQGVSFISKQKTQWTGSSETRLDPEPIVSHITVERVR